MTASPEWVEANGGVDSIYIVRLGDDGKQQVLKTRFIGYDEKGNMIFEAESPDGLSVFGLVSAKATEEKLAEDKNATVVAVSKPAMSINVGMAEWLLCHYPGEPADSCCCSGSHCSGCVLRMVEEKVVTPVTNLTFFADRMVL